MPVNAPRFAVLAALVLSAGAAAAAPAPAPRPPGPPRPPSSGSRPWPANGWPPKTATWSRRATSWPATPSPRPARAVVETVFPGSAHEMVTVYHADGPDLVLTHYCMEGNQPRMRAKGAQGSRFDFAFDGGTNIDPKRDRHMHSATCRARSARTRSAASGPSSPRASRCFVAQHAPRAQGALTPSAHPSRIERTRR